MELLNLRGLNDTTKVKFVRHQDSHVDLTELMILGYLDRYQRVQSRPVFKNCDFIVSFIGLSQSRARFLGVYRVNGVRFVKDVPAPADYPLPEEPDYFCYDLEKIEGFADLEERIIIDWGKSARAWHQWSQTIGDSEVIELLPRGYTRPFPGYLDFILSHDELVRICTNPEANVEWFHKLSAVGGIYLITYNEKLYVGSASGEDGILGRWQEYAVNGHGGNVKLEALQAADPDCYKHFRYSVLRTLPLSTPKKEIIFAEVLTMEKLGSRSVSIGLNSQTGKKSDVAAAHV
jgi:hypothetical protein